MTAPVPDVLGRLRAVAAWEVPLLRRASATLTAAAERLPIWRARLEGVARSLDTGESWAGPAARSTAAAVRELSTVTWVVERALAESLAAFDELGAEAGWAQELAHQALARAAEVPGGVAAALADRAGLAGAVDALVPGAGLTPAAPALAAAEAALGHAAAVTAAAEQAGAALVAVGALDAFAPADFAALAGRVPVADPICALPAPAGAPEVVAHWWAGLPLTTQLAALVADPAGLGGRDGVPAWARDRANRMLLAAALVDPQLDASAAVAARSVARRLEIEEEAGRQAQLQLFDVAGDRVVLGLGDLDSADAVAVLVPGINNSPGDDLGRLVGDARAVAGAAREAAPGLAVASVVWLGYDSPSNPAQIIRRGNAVDGGAALAASLAGLRAGREAVAAQEARATVLAHSYGTVVVDEAADVPGRLDADAVVLMGSPGMEDHARSLEAPEVYDAVGSSDFVAATQWFGRWTGSPVYGSTELPVESGAGHSDYYEPDGATLAAVGEVVAGERTPR